VAEALLRGAIHPNLAKSTGAALAKLALGTSRSVLGPSAHDSLAATVEQSSSVADVMEDHVFYLVGACCGVGLVFAAGLIWFGVLL